MNDKLHFRVSDNEGRQLIMVSDAAESFLKERYFRDGEDWPQLCDRVASFLANNEQERQEYYDMMFECRALPNSPTLMNAGTELGYLSACNLVPVPDSLEGIMEAVKSSTIIQKQGGGCGMNFSKLRPTGDTIGSTGGTSSGVISFLRIFDVASQVVKQGGKRRSANLGLLKYDHPDILRWIHAKDKDGELPTFNLSIGLTDEFFEKVERGTEIVFINPRTNKPFPAYDPATEIERSFIPSRELFNRIAKAMWSTGEPGVLFWDEIQRRNTTPSLGNLQGTNPCGETNLYFWESCVLGSINLYAHVKETDFGMKIDYDAIGQTTRVMTRFLNTVLDKNQYPLQVMEKAAKKTRKIGIGVMGLADTLAILGIEYGTDESIERTREIMQKVSEISKNESVRLKDRNGTYPAWVSGDGIERRNGAITSIAPTGSISFIAGVSCGIEPFFKMAYQMNREDKDPAIVIAKSLEHDLEKHGKMDILGRMLSEVITPQQLVKEGILPESFNSYITAGEVTPEAHVRMQATIQEYTDMSISKTINVPNETTIDGIKNIIKLAYESKCKGMTIFRDNCFRDGFLSEVVCTSCGSTNIDHKEGCITCTDCGVSLCSVS